jgi:glycerol-3-phosphate dehydrogenase
LTS